MSGANTFKFVMLPPQSDITRGWGRQLAEAMPEVRVVIAEDQATAEREIVDAEAAFGRLPREVLAKARRLRWLQAPQIAPPAGYYYPELIEHSLTVTNFREIFNDHISAHIMAFVLAFARGLHVYHPAAAAPRVEEDAREQRRRAPAGGDRADRRRGRHRRGDRAAGRGVRHDGAGDRCAPHRAAARCRGTAQAGGAGCAAAAGGFRHPDGAAHAGDRRLHAPRALPAHEARAHSSSTSAAA